MKTCSEVKNSYDAATTYLNIAASLSSHTAGSLVLLPVTIFTDSCSTIYIERTPRSEVRVKVQKVMHLEKSPGCTVTILVHYYPVKRSHIAYSLWYTTL